MFSISAALFIFGAALAINRKSNFLTTLVAVGSLALVAAGFAYAYLAPIQTLIFGYMKSISYETIYRVYALPLFIASAIFFVVGFVLMFRVKLKTKPDTKGRNSSNQLRRKSRYALATDANFKKSMRVR